MKFFGLNLHRLREWTEVLKEERKTIGLHEVYAMAKGALAFWNRPSRAEWRRRMRICAKCPLYDSGMRRCRPFTGAPVGCGCYMPYKAQGRGPCWLRERDPSAGW